MSDPFTTISVTDAIGPFLSPASRHGGQETFGVARKEQQGLPALVRARLMRLAVPTDRYAEDLNEEVGRGCRRTLVQVSTGRLGYMEDRVGCVHARMRIIEAETSTTPREGGPSGAQDRPRPGVHFRPRKAKDDEAHHSGSRRRGVPSRWLRWRARWTSNLPSPGPSIAGTWHWEDDTGLVTITLDPDGTWEATWVVGSSREGSWGSGTWQENSDHAPGNMNWAVTDPKRGRAHERHGTGVHPRPGLLLRRRRHLQVLPGNHRPHHDEGMGGMKGIKHQSVVSRFTITSVNWAIALLGVLRMDDLDEAISGAPDPKQH
jgi:hypothetical protein